MKINPYLKASITGQNIEKINNDWETEHYKNQKWDYSENGKRVNRVLSEQKITHLFDHYNKNEIKSILIDVIENKIRSNNYLNKITNKEIHDLMLENYNSEIKIECLIGYDDNFKYNENITASKIYITIPKCALNIKKIDNWITYKHEISGNITHKLEHYYLVKLKDIHYTIEDYNKYSLKSPRLFKREDKEFEIKNNVILKFLGDVE